MVLIFIVPSCLLKFKLLSIWNYTIQGSIIIFSVLALLITAEVLEPKNLKFYLKIIPAFILLFGVLLIIINLRLTKLQPIAFATAYLELSFKPTKIDDSKMEESELVGIDLIKEKTALPFMRYKHGVSWGRKGLAEELKLYYVMDWFSIGYGEPFDFIDKYDTIGFAVYMLPENTEITKGRCVFIFNGVKRKEIEIPPQKTFLWSVYSNPQKKPEKPANVDVK